METQRDALAKPPREGAPPPDESKRTPTPRDDELEMRTAAQMVAAQVVRG